MGKWHVLAIMFTIWSVRPNLSETELMVTTLTAAGCFITGLFSDGGEKSNG